MIWRINKMKTGKNKATHNYYNNKCRKASDNMYGGTIESVQTKEQKHFNSPAQLLSLIERMFREDEK